MRNKGSKERSFPQEFFKVRIIEWRSAILRLGPQTLATYKLKKGKDIPLLLPNQLVSNQAGMAITNHSLEANYPNDFLPNLPRTRMKITQMTNPENKYGPRTPITRTPIFFT